MSALIGSDADIDTSDEAYCLTNITVRIVQYIENISLKYEVAQITDTHNFTTFLRQSL